MSYLKKISALVVGIAMAMASSSASAATVVTRFSGTVAGGYDNTGLSGVTGSAVSGLPYEVVFRFNVKQPGATVLSEQGLNAISGSGPSSMGSTLITVGAFTWELAAEGGYNLLYRSDGTVNGGLHEVYATATGFTGSTYRGYIEAFVHSSVDAFTASPNYDDPLSPYTSAPGGSQFWFHYTYGGDQEILVYNLGSPSTVSVTVSGVPEPATWALMIFGFGLTGSVLRTARRKHAVACCTLPPSSTSWSFEA